MILSAMLKDGSIITQEVGEKLENTYKRVLLAEKSGNLIEILALNDDKNVYLINFEENYAEVNEGRFKLTEPLWDIQPVFEVAENIITFGFEGFLNGSLKRSVLIISV